MLTVPNALSVLRLVLVPVFLYLLLVAHAYGWAVAVLTFSGFSDWADGKIARLVANQSSRLGTAGPRGRPHLHGDGPGGLGGPWHRSVVDRDLLIGRDALLASTPAAAQPRPDRAAGDLHRQGRDVRADVGVPIDPAGPVGRAVEPRHPGLWLGLLDLGDGALFVVGVLYLIQVAMVMRRTQAEQWLIQGALGGYEPGGRTQRPRGRRPDTSRCRRCCGRCCPTTSIPATPPPRPSAARAARGRAWERRQVLAALAVATVFATR